jgi:hypothetical protein
MERRMEKLRGFLEKCEYVYLYAPQKTVENCEFFITTLHNALIVKKGGINDAYLFEPSPSPLYNRH